MQKSLSELMKPYSYLSGNESAINKMAGRVYIIGFLMNPFEIKIPKSLSKKHLAHTEFHSVEFHMLSR